MGSEGLPEDPSDAAQEQMPDVLKHDTELMMLEKQTQQVDKQIRAAQGQTIHGKPATRSAIFIKSQYVPEENKILRRELAARNRELFQLRKVWWTMRSSSTVDGYRNNSLPAQCQSVVKMLLSDEPTAPVPVPLERASSSPVVPVETPAGFMLTSGNLGCVGV